MPAVPEGRQEVSDRGEVVMAFDYGERRIGVAVGQTALGTASPVGALPARGRPDWNAVERCLRDWAPDRVLVGVPYNVDGTENVLTAACRAFAAEISSRSGLPVELVDERLTTAAAERAMIEGGARRSRRRETIDQVAAVLLLQSHLDRRHD